MTLAIAEARDVFAGYPAPGPSWETGLAFLPWVVTAARAASGALGTAVAWGTVGVVYDAITSSSDEETEGPGAVLTSDERAAYAGRLGSMIYLATRWTTGEPLTLWLGLTKRAITALYGPAPMTRLEADLLAVAVRQRLQSALSIQHGGVCTVSADGSTYVCDQSAPPTAPQSVTLPAIGTFHIPPPQQKAIPWAAIALAAAAIGVLLWGWR